MAPGSIRRDTPPVTAPLERSQAASGTEQVRTLYLWDCYGHQPAQVQISSANPRA